MKRFLCLLLVFLMIAPGACAETIGEYLNRQTTEDLIAIRDYINDLIAERQAISDGFVTYGNASIKYKDAYIKKSGNTEKIVIVFDWTNNGDSAASFGYAFDFEAYQDGVQLSVGIIWDFDTQFTTKIQPGKTLEGYYIWELRDGKTPVTVVFDKFLDLSNKYPDTKFEIDLSSIKTKN